jgi:outer membrane protein TolC
MQPLNALLGLPPETELQLVIPEPVSFEPVSLSTALDNAMATSPELAEAEQTVVKARAAAKLGKLDYVPDVALIGGYYYQTTFDLLPSDFSFIGVAASFNVFDFGKREKTLKERQANVELAEMNLAAVRAKVGAGVGWALIFHRFASHSGETENGVTSSEKSGRATKHL